MRGGGKGDVSLQRGGKAMGYTEGAERGRGLSGVTFHAHLETQMADGLQNRFPGVRSFAHLGGRCGSTEGRNVGEDSQEWLPMHTWKRKWLTDYRIGFRV